VRRPCSPKRGRASALRRRRHRPHQPDRLDLARRGNPGFRATTFDELRLAYTEQVEGLIEGGADLLLIETIFDTLNAKAAICAIAEVLEARDARAVMISGTITDRSGGSCPGRPRPHSGIRCGTPTRYDRAECSLGERAAPCDEISRIADTLVCAYPNAGLPTSSAATTRAPTIWVSCWRVRLRRPGQHRRRLLWHHAEHIAAIARAVEGEAPRKVPKCRAACVCPAWSSSR